MLTGIKMTPEERSRRKQEKESYLLDWHRKFVIWPRVVEKKNGGYREAYCQWVERRGTKCIFQLGEGVGNPYFYEWEYREIPKPQKETLTFIS